MRKTRGDAVPDSRYPLMRGAVYRLTSDPSAVAPRAAISTLQVREDRKRADQRCGCDEEPSALCTEHAALIIELL
jgi:hypothetical protein